ncbi:MAG TPA: ArsR family transcriptional regulator [Euzebyales bacterium]
MSTPPAFIQLAAHPLRWSLLAELGESDYRVRELAARIDEPQNLVSYHLRLLRDGGLVTATRSSFDGRESYYRLDLDRCAGALNDSGRALHPALGPIATPPTPPVAHTAVRDTTVLFVCTGNTARSPIAEALLRHRTAGRVRAASAGSRPGHRLHVDAIRVLREAFGIDITGQRPRSLDALTDREFDRVITLCDRAREVCPVFPHRPRRAHWSIPDPARIDDGGYPAFQRIAADIDARIRYLLAAMAAHDRQEPAP